VKEIKIIIQKTKNKFLYIYIYIYFWINLYLIFALLIIAYKLTY